MGCCLHTLPMAGHVANGRAVVLGDFVFGKVPEVSMGIKPLRNCMQKWKFSKVCSSRCLNIYWLSQDLWT